jgi:acyl-CoA synthetase (NDP forming)
VLAHQVEAEGVADTGTVGFEGFKEADKFLEVAKLAAERGRPITLSKSGARAARSDTAALTGSDARYDTIFAQYG